MCENVKKKTQHYEMEQCIPTLGVGIPKVPQGVLICHCVGKLILNATSLIFKLINLEVKLKSYKPQKLSNS